MSVIYRVTGIVEHPDGSDYSPLYWGSLPTARLVLDAIEGSALQEGAGFDLTLDKGDTVGIVCRRYRPVPAPGYTRAPFALVTAGPEYSVLEVSA